MLIKLLNAVISAGLLFGSLSGSVAAAQSVTEDTTAVQTETATNEPTETTSQPTQPNDFSKPIEPTIDSETEKITDSADENTSEPVVVRDKTDEITETTSEEATETTEAAEPTEPTEAPAVRQKRMAPAPADVADVSDWDQLNTALANSAVTNIQVTDDISATSASTAVTRTVMIDFGGHILSLGGNHFTINSSGKLTLNDLRFDGDGSLGSGSGKLRLTGTIMGKTAKIAEMPSGTVEMDGVELTYDQGASEAVALQAKNLTIMNQSKVVANTGKFFKSSASNTKIIIAGQSTVETNSFQNAAEGKAWEITGQTSTISVQESATLKVNGDLTNKTGFGGLFTITGTGSQLAISSQSTFEGNSQNATVISIQGTNSQFNVSGKSIVKLEQDNDQGNVLGSTINLGRADQMAFSIDGQSQVTVEKNGGTAAAIRLEGTDNQFLVQGKSELTVMNEGDGTPADPGSDGRNQGIQYIQYATVQDKGATLKIAEEDSLLDVTAANGAAIDFGSSKYAIIDGSGGAYVFARGQTASKAKGILNTNGKLLFLLQRTKSFDFRNDRVGGGYLVSSNNESALAMLSLSGDPFYTSFWLSGSNLDSTPRYQWDTEGFTFSGTNLSNAAGIMNDDMRDTFYNILTTGMPSFSRMSVSNRPETMQIDELRVPTNADKFIYAHAAVSAGKGGRGAQENEAYVKIGIYDEAGKQVATVDGASLGDSLQVYGEEARTGMFKIPVPDGKFLQAGYSLRILEARTGYDGKNWQTEIPAEKISQASVKVVDVTPPDPASIGNEQTTITTGTKTLSGNGEPGAAVLLSINGNTPTNTAVIDPAGQFTMSLPENLKNGDHLQIFLQDHAGKAQVSTPPATNNEVGNIQPATDLTYHDAVFKKAITLEVNGGLTLMEVPDLITFGEQSVTNQTQNYQPQVTGKLTVSDTRGTGKKAWQLKLKEAEGLHSTTNDLSGLLTYQNKNGAVPINSDLQVVETEKLTDDGEMVVSDSWDQERGLSLTVPVAKQQRGDYQGKLNWSLEDVPGNN